MSTTKGSNQVGLTRAPPNTSANTYYVTKFVSQPIYQTSISAQTWTYGFATSESSTSHNWPVSGNNVAVPVNIYVWRPSNGTLVGTISDGTTAATVDEGGTGTRFHIATISGSAVNNVQDGDVIVLEVWFTTTSTVTTGTIGFYYDGTDDTYADGATSVTQAASYLETPENLQLVQLTRVYQSNTIKYHLLLQVLSQSYTLKYNIQQRIAQSNTLKYNLLLAVARAIVLRYDLLGQVIKACTLRYLLLKQVLQSNSLVYNVEQAASPGDTILGHGGDTISWYTASDEPALTDWPIGSYTWYLKVTQANANVTLSQVTLLRLDSTRTIIKASKSVNPNVALSTAQTYSDSLAWSDGTQNPVGRLSTDIFAVTITLAGASNQTVLISFESPDQTRIDTPLSGVKELLERVLQSATLRYNLQQRITQTQTIKYNIALQVLRSNTLRYSLLALIAKNITLRYSLLQQILRPIILKYNLLVALQKSNTLKYNLLQQVLKSNTLRYNLIGRIVQAAVLRYNLLLGVKRSNIVKYSLLRQILASRTIRYNMLKQVTNAIVIKWNLFALLTRVARSFTILYNILEVQKPYLAHPRLADGIDWRRAVRQVVHTTWLPKSKRMLIEKQNYEAKISAFEQALADVDRKVKLLAASQLLHKPLTLFKPAEQEQPLKLKPKLTRVTQTAKLVSKVKQAKSKQQLEQERSKAKSILGKLFALVKVLDILDKLETVNADKLPPLLLRQAAVRAIRKKPRPTNADDTAEFQKSLKVERALNKKLLPLIKRIKETKKLTERDLAEIYDLTREAVESVYRTGAAYSAEFFGAPLYLSESDVRQIRQLTQSFADRMKGRIDQYILSRPADKEEVDSEFISSTYASYVCPHTLSVAIKDKARELADKNKAATIPQVQTQLHSGATLEEEQGIQIVLVWITAKDDRVCNICQGLESSEYGLHDANIPAPDSDTHPNCRCRLVLEERALPGGL